MFWNTEFLDSAPSHIDVVLQMPTVKLSDILFEDDLLQELKTSNLNLDNFLTRPEIIAELVDNITQLTEKDCCDKLLYSNVHAAYISCEILTGGPSEIFAAFMNHPESLNKIISCLTIKPKQQNRHQQTKQEQTDQEQEQQQQEQQSQNENKIETEVEVEEENPSDIENGTKNEIETVPKTKTVDEFYSDDEYEEDNPDNPSDIQADLDSLTRQQVDVLESMFREAQYPCPWEVGDNRNHVWFKNRRAKHRLERYKQIQISTDTSASTKNGARLKTEHHSLQHDPGSQDSPASEEREPEIVYMTRVVPQKATLVSKLLSTIHASAAAKLSCHITRDINSFSRLIDLLVKNIDISGAFEILSTFIKRTEPPELRYVFCEILSNLKFVQKLIDVMTLSDIEDKQRNACQLLCDIIVIGRQDASEQTSGPKAQDMLSELLESSQSVHVMLAQMFLGNMRNTTAIVCGMKVLQTLLENKLTADQQSVQQQNRTIQNIEEEINDYLIKFHELLLNPPKQQPIKTTFGIIQKPLGYMRLEVVNLIRALISTNSGLIIRKLVYLKTMKVIIDLFIEYSWNNLLHTQVEQALCLIINNCRKDEEESTLSELFAQCNQFNKNQGGVWKQSQIFNELIAKSKSKNMDQEQNQESQEKALGEQVQKKMENGELMQEPSKQEHQPQETSELQAKTQTQAEQLVKSENSVEPEQSNQPDHSDNREQSEQIQQSDQLEQPQQHSNSPLSQPQHPQNQESPQMRQGRSVLEPPSVALLSQLLNECDLIGRLLMPSSLTNEINLDYQRRRNGEQANFGHIIQMINSIAINRDLDTIRGHLNEMKEKRAELFHRWNTFVNVDVASFKEISLYYDAQSATNHVDNRFNQTRHGGQISNNRFVTTPNVHSLGSQSDNGKSPNNNADDHFLAYVAFAREVVLPSINLDVLPTPRDMFKTIQNH